MGVYEMSYGRLRFAAVLRCSLNSPVFQYQKSAAARSISNASKPATGALLLLWFLWTIYALVLGTVGGIIGSAISG
jgi:hypothetical protein